MKLESYWLDTAPAFTAAAEGQVPQRADVVVVGGGFSGLSAAHALAKSGAKVVLLEAGRIAAEASGRNGGHCNPGLAHDYADLAARLGEQRARGYWEAYDDAVDTVERLVREEGIDCDFRRCGKLKLAAKPQHFEKLQRVHARLISSVDPTAELITPERLASEIGSDRYYGGLLQKEGAQMHMGRFANGLGAAAVRAGAQVFQNAAVTGIEKNGGGYRITSARGVIDAKQVFIATGNSSIGPFGY